MKIDISNDSFYFVPHGSKEYFGGKSCIPRWLCFHNDFSIGRQVTLMREVTATCQKLMKLYQNVATERNSMWLKWYQGDRKVSLSYENKHLQQIIAKFPDIIINSNSTQVRSQISEMMKCTNCIPNEFNIRGNNDTADINDTPNKDLIQKPISIIENK